MMSMATNHTFDAFEGVAQYRIEDGSETERMLRQLMDDAIPVQLTTLHHGDVRCHLTAMDPAQRHLQFNVTALPSGIDAPDFCSSELACIAYPGSVKLQFKLTTVALARRGDHAVLHASMPQAIYRLQRRDSFRVRAQESDKAHVQLRHPTPPHPRLSLKILDVSVRGCALWLPASAAPIASRSEIREVCFELGGDVSFLATLFVHHAFDMRTSEGGQRLGCEMLNLAGTSERALQRFVDQTQKRQRWASALI